MKVLYSFTVSMWALGSTMIEIETVQVQVKNTFHAHLSCISGGTVHIFLVLRWHCAHLFCTLESPEKMSSLLSSLILSLTFLNCGIEVDPLVDYSDADTQIHLDYFAIKDKI